MKKFLLGFLIFILALIVIGVGFFFYLKIPLSVEKILPEGAVVYLKISDVENNTKKFIQMPVWQTILNLNYDVLLKNKIITEAQKSNLEAIKQYQEQVINHFLFKKFLGQEITLAFCIDDLDLGSFDKMASGQQVKLATELLSNLFFITRLEPEAQMAEAFLKMLSSSLGQDVTIEFVKYKGHTIQTFITSDKNVKISMTRIKDLLILGLGDKAAKTAIDVFRKERNSLGKDRNFMLVEEQRLKGASINGVLNISRIVEKFSPYIEKMVAGVGVIAVNNNQRDEALENINQFKIAGMSIVTEDVLKIKMNVYKNEKSRKFNDPDICSLRDNQTVALAPKDALFYVWNSCLDLNYYWNEAKKELAKISKIEEGGVAQDKVKAFEQQIGVQIEQEILPVFGKEIGGYLANIDIQKSFVLPEFLVFVEIQDKEKADALLDKLLAKSFFPLKEEKYSDIALHYMEMPFPKMGPAYCYLDKYLLIAMNQDLLKKSIDLYKEKANSLVADNDFKSLDPKLMEKNVFSLFSRFNAISMKFKDIMDFVSLLADAQDNKIRAFQSGSQKRIEDVKKNVIKNEDSIKEIQKEQESLKDKIWDLEAGQLDAKIEQDKMKSLEEKIQTLTLETASDQKTIQELSEGITGYSQALEESAVQKIYVQEAVYPVLNSLSFIQSFSMRQNNQPQDLETMIFIKTQK